MIRVLLADDEAMIRAGQNRVQAAITAYEAGMTE